MNISVETQQKLFKYEDIYFKLNIRGYVGMQRQEEKICQKILFNVKQKKKKLLQKKTIMHTT